MPIEVQYTLTRDDHLCISPIMRPPAPGSFSALAPCVTRRSVLAGLPSRNYTTQRFSNNRQNRQINSPLRPTHAHLSSYQLPANSTVSVLPQQSHRTYYTPHNPPPHPYSPAEEAILSAALLRAQTHGFTQEALSLGASDAGYLPASTNLFPRGVFDLVLYHHVTKRLDLKNRVQFPTPLTDPSAQQNLGKVEGGGGKPLSVTAKVRALLLARLHANEPLLPHLPEALALQSLAGNIPSSLTELARLSDEIWYLSGDTAVDGSWYSKRALLAGVYASAEVFMTRDGSEGFRETEEFVERRLDGVRRVGGTVGAVGEWVGFTAGAAVNVARAWGARI